MATQTGSIDFTQTGGIKLYAAGTYSTKNEAYQSAQPNLSPFFSKTPMSADAGYWSGTSSYWTPTSDGWARFSRSVTSATNTDIAVMPQAWLEVGKTYTVLLEWRNVTVSGSADMYYSEAASRQMSAISSTYITTSSGSVYKTTTCLYASDDDGVTRFFWWRTRLAANSSLTGEFRLSIYPGEYTGPYKPYAGVQLYATQAELEVQENEISMKVSESDVTGNYLVGKINLDATTATIAASKVNIEGAAIFTGNGRLSQTSLDGAYDANGAAATAKSEAISAAATDATAKANAVQTNLDNLEIGGRNLLRYVVYNYASQYNTNILVKSAYRGMYCAVDGGETYTISRRTVEGNRFRIYWSEQEPASGVETHALSLNNTALKVTVDVPSEANWLFVYLSNQGDVINDGNIKVERGNKATDWTPAPEDLLAEEQYIYISSASGTTSINKNTTWVTQSSDVQNVWTTKRPTYNSSYPVLFVAKQSKTVGGSVSCTTPVKDDTTTVIDGAHITTGTIDTNRLNSDTIKSNIVQTTNLSATQITSGDISADRIKANVIGAINSLTAGTIDAARINASQLTIGQSQVTGLTTALGGKADTADIPTNVSDLTNDSGFQTSSQVESAITGKGYQTSSQVESAITSKGYATTSQAQGYANTAKDEAISAAATDATTKANAVQDNLNATRAWYAECPTAAGNAAKVATITPATTDFALAEGVTVAVKFTYANGVASPTLNVNNTGGKSIKRYGTTAPSTSAASSWNAGNVVTLVYDGTYWQMTNWLNNNDNYYDRENYKAALAASTEIAADRVAAMGSDNKLKILAANSAFDISGPILYVRTAYSAANVTDGATRTTNYTFWGTPFALTNTHAITGAAAGKPVYIVGTLSGNMFTPNSDVFTCTTPTSTDNLVYMRLGIMSTTANAVLESQHPLYMYFNGAFQQCDKSTADAAKTATNYISLDTDGIKIADANPSSATTYLQLASTFLDFVRGGSSMLKAWLDGAVAKVRVGSESGFNTLTDDEGIKLRSGTTVLSQFATSLIELGKNSTGAVIKMCGNKGSILYDSTNNYPFQIKSDESMLVGAMDGSSLSSSITMRGDISYMGVSADKITFFSDTVGFYPTGGGSQDYSTANVMSALDKSIPQGTVVSSSPNAVSVATSSNVTLGSITLAAGTWMVVVSATFASNNSGRRVVYFADDSSVSSVAVGQMAALTQAPADGGMTKYSSFAIVSPTASTTYYCRAWQNSGSTLSCQCYLRAVRIA